LIEYLRMIFKRLFSLSTPSLAANAVLGAQFIERQALLKHLQRPPAEFGSFRRFLACQKQALRSESHEQLAHGLRDQDLPVVKQDAELRELLSLRYAPRQDLQRVLRQRVVEFYGRRLNDTGRAEVQIGLFTMRLDLMAEHCQAHPKDHKAARLLVHLGHRRQRMLRYLFRTDLDRFYRCLDELGLSREYLDKLDDKYTYLKKHQKADAKKGTGQIQRKKIHRTVRGGGTHLDLSALRETTPSIS
jgi:ribosomal protein S15